MTQSYQWLRDTKTCLLEIKFGKVQTHNKDLG